MTYRLNLAGNTDIAKLLLPMARKELETLKNQMSFANLGQLQRTVKLASGAVINVERVLGQDTINILVPEIEVKKEEAVEELQLTKNFVVIELISEACDSGYVIWNIEEGRLYSGFEDEAYPINEEALKDWIDTTFAEDVTEDDIYSVELAGETVIAGGTSANTGCGVLTNDIDFMTKYLAFYDAYGYCDWGEDACCIEMQWYESGAWQGQWETCPECEAVWIWEDKFTNITMKAFILGALKSYNLTIQVEAFKGETTCIRNETDYHDRDYYWPLVTYLPPGSEYDDWTACGRSQLPIIYKACHVEGLRYNCELKTSLGDFAVLELWNEYESIWTTACTWPSGNRETSKMWDGYDVPLVKGVYSAEVYVQIFGYWGRIKTVQAGSTTYEVTGEVKCAVNEYSSVNNVHPTEQEEDEGFTTSISELINKFIDDNTLTFATSADGIDLDIKIYKVPEETL